VSGLAGKEVREKRTRGGEDEEETPAETFVLDASNEPNGQQYEGQISEDVRCGQP